MITTMSDRETNDIRDILQAITTGKINVHEAYQQIEKCKQGGQAADTGPILTRTYIYGEPALQDHQGKNPFDQRQDSQVLLGVTHGSLAIEAGHQLYPDQDVLHIHRLLITEPVVLYPGEMVDIGIVLKPGIPNQAQADGGKNFVSLYRSSSPRLSGQPGREAAQGQFLLSPGPSARPPGFDIAGFKAQCRRSMPADPVYGRKESERGPSLRALQHVWLRGEEILGELRLLPETVKNGYKYLVQPALLDGAFVASLAGQAGESHEAAQRPGLWIPFMIKDMRVFIGRLTPPVQTCYCHCKPVKVHPELLALDIHLYDDQGHPLVMLEEFTYRFTRYGASPHLPPPGNESGHKEHYSPTPKTVSPGYTADLTGNIETYISGKLAASLGLPRDFFKDRRQGAKNFMELGVDSNSLVIMSREIEKELGVELYPTLFFEYQNIKELTGYFAREHGQILAQYFHQAPGQGEKPDTREPRHEYRPPDPVAPGKRVIPDLESRDIAIIGMAGRFARSGNLEEFWQNLKESRDLITEVPADHWDWRPWFDENRQAADKTYCKWGSFIEADKFDPLFFGINQREAVWLDPQLRLLLEVVHSTIEDAGYGRKIPGSDTGVFVGACLRDYWDEIVRAQIPFTDYQASSSLSSSLSGRISYTFDLHGSSVPVDNACASSLTAIHLACQSLHDGECDLALVAGVNLILSPLHYVYSSRFQALSPSGRCYTFDKAADGYVPGEGVAALLLKPLAKARRDGDLIHAVIKGSAVNHVGHSNNPTAPRPEFQSKLLVKAWEKAGINPGTLSYIEAHGTGTQLGDPIEIEALKKAFAQYTDKKGFCFLGSAKAHIGHLEGAAGIAGVIKTVLSMQKRQIPAMPHFKELNPYLSLDDSPFVINRSLQPWEAEPGIPRRAGVSSFGITGNNVHLVLEEYVSPPEEQTTVGPAPISAIIALSAADKERLHVYAQEMADFLEKTGNADGDSQAGKPRPEDVAFTLQVGRQAREERLALVVSDLEELVQKLRLCSSAGEKTDRCYRGNVNKDKDRLDFLSDVEDRRVFIDSLVKSRKFDKLAKLWAAGLDIEWEQFYQGFSPRIVSLPTYPFARERYWIPDHLLANREKAPHLETPGLEQQMQDFLWAPRWKPAPLAARPVPQPPEPDAEKKTVIIYSSPSKALKEALAVHVAPGRLIDIDTDAATGFDDLGDQAGSIRAIYFLAGIWTDFTAADDLDTLDCFQEKALFPLFRLIKFLSSRGMGWRPIQLTVVTHNGIQVPGHSPLIPYASLLHGLVRTLAAEFSSWHIGCLDIDLEETTGGSSPVMSIDTLAGHILHEPPHPQGRVVAIRRGQRYVNVFEPLRLPPLEQTGHVPLKKGGVYLIVGGAGKIGMQVSRYLAREKQAHVALLGRSPLDEGKQRQLDEIESLGGRAIYLQADVTDETGMKAAVEKIKATFRTIAGVIHAGMDVYSQALENMEEETFRKGLAPKTRGSAVLYRVLKGEALDFLLFFASCQSFIGEPGLSSYTAGNRFEDALAYCLDPQEKFPVRSIDWGYWETPGEVVEEIVRRRIQEDGLIPFGAGLAIEALQRVLAGSITHVMALKADNRLKQDLRDEPVSRPRPQPGPAISRGAPVTLSHPAPGLAPDQFVEETIVSVLADILQIDRGKFHLDTPYIDFGIDSILAIEMVNRIDRRLNIGLRSTDLFNYPTIRKLSVYILDSYNEAIRAAVTAIGTGQAPREDVQQPEATREMAGPPPSRWTDFYPAPAQEQTGAIPQPIAVIGMSGRFPGADNLEEFWENLAAGRDSVQEIRRWRLDTFYDPDPDVTDKSYCKWGGLLPDIAAFDPLFFNISPREAEMMEPQQRLFLEEAWQALEDAGYPDRALDGQKCGVFVGFNSRDYDKLIEQSHIPPDAYQMTGNFEAMMPARVSYFLNLRGPAVTVNTACSASLVALHLACESIRGGTCDMAIVGGVAIMTQPEWLILLSRTGVLSLNGRCRAFDNAADGIVPGEAVVAVVIKKLDTAVKDRDHIYGVVIGSGINQDGKTNGITAPSAPSQTALECEVYDRSRIDPQAIGYIEAHGTGTRLGDPIEIDALTDAFRKYTANKQFCAIGSVKSNIGHSMAAAGLCAFIKVLLCLEKKKLVPSINLDQVNEFIDFTHSPFYVNTRLEEWKSPADSPRIAAVSSFGFSGTNAHLVVRERTAADWPAPGFSGRQSPYYLVPLSAKTPAAHRQKLEDMRRWLAGKGGAQTLPDISYTALVGRSHFSIRAIFIIANKEDLAEKIRAILEDKETAGYLDGVIADTGFKPDPALRQQGEQAITDLQNKSLSPSQFKEKLAVLAGLYTRGYDLDWQRLYEGEDVRRTPLPGYPFTRQRYWVDPAASTPQGEPDEDEELLGVLKKVQDGSLDVKEADHVLRDFYRE